MNAPVELGHCPHCGRGLHRRDEIETDSSARLVCWRDEIAQLTPKQFEIFDLLFRRRPRAVTLQAIYDHIYQLRDADSLPQPKILDVHICNLRKAIAALPVGIESVRAAGYRLVVDDKHRAKPTSPEKADREPRGRRSVPTLGYPSRKDAVLALMRKGLTNAQIAEKAGTTIGTVSTVTAQERRRTRMAMPRPGLSDGAESASAPLSALATVRLEKAAAARGIDVAELCRKILTEIADDNLVDAILDDGGAEGDAE